MGPPGTPDADRIWLTSYTLGHLPVARPRGMDVTGRTLVSLFVLIALLLTSVPALGGKEVGTETLAINDSIDFHIDASDGGPTDIAYEVVVTDGPEIDVFFMDAECYESFLVGDPFEYYIDMSVLGTQDAKKEWTWSQEGEFYIVIDNTFAATKPPLDEGNVTLTYVVEWEAWGATDWLAWGMVFIVATVILVVLLVLVVRARERARIRAQMEEETGWAEGEPPTQDGPGEDPPEPPT